MSFLSIVGAPLPPIRNPTFSSYNEVALQVANYASEPTTLRSHHTKRVTCLDWHFDGKYLASGSLDGTVCIYDIKHILNRSNQNRNLVEKANKFLVPRFDLVQQREDYAHARTLLSTGLEPIPQPDNCVILNRALDDVGMGGSSSSSSGRDRNGRGGRYSRSRERGDRTDRGDRSNSNATDGNGSSSSNKKKQTGRINSVRWHPKSDALVLATASSDHTVYLWRLQQTLNSVHKHGRQVSEAVPFHIISILSSVLFVEWTHESNEILTVDKGDSASDKPNLTAFKMDLHNSKNREMRLQARLPYNYTDEVTDMRVFYDDRFVLLSTRAGTIDIYDCTCLRRVHVLEVCDSSILTIDLNNDRYRRYLSDQRTSSKSKPKQSNSSNNNINNSYNGSLTISKPRLGSNLSMNTTSASSASNTFEMDSNQNNSQYGQYAQYSQYPADLDMDAKDREDDEFADTSDGAYDAYPVYGPDRYAKYQRFSPFLAASGKSGTALVYKCNNMVCVYGTPLSHLSGISKVRFNAEGNLLAAGGDTDGSLRLVYVPTGAILHPARRIVAPPKNSSISSNNNNSNVSNGQNGSISGGSGNNGHAGDIVMNGTHGTHGGRGGHDGKGVDISINVSGGRAADANKNGRKGKNANKNGKIKKRVDPELAEEEDEDDVEVQKDVELIKNLGAKLTNKKDLILYHHYVDDRGMNNANSANKDVNNNNNINSSSNNNSGSNSSNNYNNNVIYSKLSNMRNVQSMGGYGSNRYNGDRWFRDLVDQLKREKLPLGGTEDPHHHRGGGGGARGMGMNMNDNEKEKQKKIQENSVYDIAWNPKHDKYLMFAFCDESGNGIDMMETNSSGSSNNINNNNSNNKNEEYRYDVGTVKIWGGVVSR